VLQTTAGKMIFGRYIDAGMGASAPVAAAAPPPERVERARTAAPAAPILPQQT
jgi:hypothetical protein